MFASAKISRMSARPIANVDRLKQLDPMRAADCISALKRAREALDEYCRQLDRAHKHDFSEWGFEARKRLNQMIWLISEIEKLGDQDAFGPLLTKASVLLQSGDTPTEDWQAQMKPEIKKVFERIAAVSEPMETLTEAFYWIAARTRAVVRQLPKMKNFEAVGVRDIRNKLLEHPEGSDSGVLLTSFAWAGETGPVLKNARHEHQTAIWRDRGLYVNTIEFAEELHRRLALATAT